MPSLSSKRDVLILTAVLPPQPTGDFIGAMLKGTSSIEGKKLETSRGPVFLPRRKKKEE